MAWVVPLYDRKAVNEAIRILLEGQATEDEVVDALVKVNNWRSSHSFPLNTFQIGLRKKARRIDPECLVAQRIKRMSSIALKLKRFPNMKLTQMQDLGGCRAIVKTVSQVGRLVQLFEGSMTLPLETASHNRRRYAARFSWAASQARSNCMGLT